MYAGMNECMHVCMHVYIHIYTYMPEYTMYVRTMRVQIKLPGHLCTSLSSCPVDGVYGETVSRIHTGTDADRERV